MTITPDYLRGHARIIELCNEPRALNLELIVWALKDAADEIERLQGGKPEIIGAAEMLEDGRVVPQELLNPFLPEDKP